MFGRMLSSDVVAVDAFEPAKRLCKIIISCRHASGLKIELDHCDLRVTLDVAERVLQVFMVKFVGVPKWMHMFSELPFTDVAVVVVNDSTNVSNVNCVQ